MKHFVLAILVALALTLSASAQDAGRRLLAPTYPIETLRSILVPRESFKPFPTWSEPAGLEKVPASIQQAYIREAERLLDARWDPIPATVTLDYVRNGNRSRYESLSFGRRRQLATLVLGELFERKSRFMDQIANGVWAICEESFWGATAHLGSQKGGSGLPNVTDPVVDLFAAETASMMAYIHYLLGPQLDKVSRQINPRIAFEIDRRVTTPYFETERWDWMGFAWKNRKPGQYVRPVNNWNPWINSNVLATALLMEEDPERRVQIVHKVMRSLDAFIEPYPADGGCDEGPSYWGRAGASLFDNLELLDLASNGKINIYGDPLIRNIGRYICNTYVADPYFLNFSDASAKMNPEVAVTYRFGKAVGDADMMALAAYTAKKTGFGDETLGGSFGVLARTLPALFTVEEIRATTPHEPLLRDVWLPDIQMMAARSQQGSNQGFYLAAQGGHNDESHNHNDVGNFVVFHDGFPVLVDAGAQTYTAQTFSSRRYEIWNNQSAYHNLPTINGIMQKDGRQYEATNVRYETNDREARYELNIEKAYPAEAKVKSWRRSLALHRGKDVELTDTYELETLTSPLTLSFMTPRNVEQAGAGRIRLIPSEAGARPVYLVYDAKQYEPRIETVKIEDSRMTGSWGNQLARILLVSRSKKIKDRSTVRVVSE